QANAGTPDIPPGVSGDGKQIGFVSLASNLVPNDRNEQLDVFITRNPFSCDDVHQCPVGEECINDFCSVIGGTPTPTATATFGANDCCQCGSAACQLPSMGGCPAECQPVRGAACLAAGTCATNTPAPTPTPTFGANDCCQCGSAACQLPSMGGCPAECQPV